MAAYMTIQITSANANVESFSAKLQQGDASKRREVIQGIVNTLLAIEGGLFPASVTATSSTVAGTVSGQTGGVSVTISLS